jgi:hypothetical protein
VGASAEAPAMSAYPDAVQRMGGATSEPSVRPSPYHSPIFLEKGGRSCCASLLLP